MPGISIACELQKLPISGDKRAIDALSFLLFDERYTAKTLLSDSNLFLAVTAYPQYPIASFDHPDFLAVVEGRVYDRESDVLERELADLVRGVFEDGDKGLIRLAHWVQKADGEFVVFLLHKPTRSVVVFNDARGMLPLYYCRQGDRLLISRELGFVTALMDVKKIDRMGVAQYMLFRYSLGENTLYEGVKRLAGGAVIRIHPGKGVFDVNVFSRFNFEEREHASKSIAEICNQAVDLLVESCRRRCDATGRWTNVFGISGGMDSRLVGLGMRAAGITCRSVTFCDPDNHLRGDVVIGKQLAKILGYDWQSFDLAPPAGKDMLKLLRMRCGMNYLAMGFILPFFQQIRQMMGPNIIYVTGDTGVALRGITPGRPFSDVDQLTKHVLTNQALLDLPAVAGLLGLRESDIFASLRAHLEAYPEDDLSMKYVHFYITQRGFVWHHDGMDRNRYFFWLATPLESIDLFRYLMNCSETHKAHYRIFAEMFRRLSPEAAALNEQCYKAPPGTLHFAINHLLKSFQRRLYCGAPPWVRTLVRKLREKNSHAPEGNMEQCFRRQLLNSAAVSDVLNLDWAEKICRDYGKTRFQTLFTVSSAIELFHDGVSSIEPYKEMILA